MLRHNYVTHDHKAMALADLLHNLEEKITIPFTGQQRPALVATGSDKVQVSGTVVAVKIGGHRQPVAQRRRDSM